MRKHLVLTTALVMGFALAGCKQDPLAKYPAEVRNAKPGDDKPKDNDPILRDSLFIDTNDFYQVKEGDTVTFEIKGRVINLPNTTFEISIDNLADFKGATFDAATGTFSWKAPQDTVKSDMQTILPLKVLMVANTNGSILAQNKTVNIFVLRELAQPQILAVNGLKNADLREGGQPAYFEASVKSTEEMSAPTLSVVLNRAGAQNGSGYVTLRPLDQNITVNPVQNSVDKTLWTFYLQVNLQDAEVTDSQADLYFGLQAYSSFGMASPVFSSQMTVKNKWADPRSSWSDEVQFTQGQENTYTFSVLDPRDEGRIEVTFSNCSSLGAQCTCSGATRSVSNCKIVWTPRAAGSQSIKYTVINRSTVPTDSSFGRRDFSGSIKILSAPKPSPTPNPTPSPAPVGGN
jgi:hypothetical protein